jgi:hypothetical protein
MRPPSLAHSVLIESHVENHDLQWRVSEADQFEYTIQSLSGSRNEGIPSEISFLHYIGVGGTFQIEVTSLDKIPFELNTSESIPYSHSSIQNNHGKKIFVIPCGNSSIISDYLERLITQVFNQSFYILDIAIFELIDEEEEIGARAVTPATAAGNTITYSLELRYLKENGTLNYLRFFMGEYQSGRDLVEIVINREIWSALIWISGSAISISVLVILVVIYKYRKRN